MRDEDKTKALLIDELKELRSQIATLEASNRTRQLNEELLLKSIERFRILFEDAPLGYQSLDENGNFIEVNKAWCKILGYEENEVIGRKFSEFIHPDSREQFNINFPRFKKLGQILGIEFEMIRKDGSEIIVAFDGKISYNSNNSFRQTHCILRDITEFKKMEEALRKSEKMNRAIIDSSPLGISIRSPKGRLLGVNQAWKKMWSLSEYQVKKCMDDDPQELILPAGEIQLGEWAPQVRKIYQEGGHLFIPELFLVSSQSGKERWVSLAYYAIENDLGDVDKVIIMTHDITELKKSAEELRESDKKYHDLVESLPQTVFETDIEGRLTFVNSNSFGKFGYNRDELDQGLNIIDMIVPEDRRRGAENFLRQINREEIGSNEYTALRKDGTTFPILVHSHAKILNGRVVGLQGILIDISEQKGAEMDRIRLMSAIEQANETIVITDKNGAIQYANPAFERVTGYALGEAIGRNPRILKSGKHDDAFYKQMWEQLTRGNVWRGEIINKRKDGTFYTEEVAISPVINSVNEIVSYVAVKHDITETKRLRELEFRAQRLEAAGRVAGQVAHDFNNLLAPLVAYPEFIREELPKGHPVLKYINDMERSANQIADINQQLLTLSRRGHYNQETLNLNEIIQYVIREMEVLPENLIIETDYDNNLMNIKGGGAQIHRIITNMINNARDAMQDVGNIRVKTENYYADNLYINYTQIPKGEYVKLTITDVGCGIPEEIRQSIFDPFFTTKTTDKKRGSGLGLSVVDAVVKDHNGFIDLKSKMGEGTSFYLYFPTTRENTDIDVTDAEIIGGTENILVVDDDSSQCTVTLSLLKKLGYNARAIENGEEAIEFLKDNPQDLLILDMIMPGGIDGTEIYRRALKINPEQRAIIVSGFAESNRVDEAIGLGVDMYLRKPLTMRSIAPAVRKSLDQKAVLSAANKG